MGSWGRRQQSASCHLTAVRWGSLAQAAPRLPGSLGRGARPLGPQECVGALWEALGRVWPSAGAQGMRGSSPVPRRELDGHVAGDRARPGCPGGEQRISAQCPGMPLMGPLDPRAPFPEAGSLASGDPETPPWVRGPSRPDFWTLCDEAQAFTSTLTWGDPRETPCRAPLRGAGWGQAPAAWVSTAFWV